MLQANISREEYWYKDHICIFNSVTLSEAISCPLLDALAQLVTDCCSSTVSLPILCTICKISSATLSNVLHPGYSIIQSFNHSIIHQLFLYSFNLHRCIKCTKDMNALLTRCLFRPIQGRHTIKLLQYSSTQLNRRF